MILFEGVVVLIMETLNIQGWKLCNENKSVVL